MASLRLIFVASLLLASFVGQVYSTACYGCMYDSKVASPNKDCKDKPEQFIHLVDCSVLGHGLMDVDEHTSKADSKEPSSYKCVTLKTSNATQKLERIRRGCIESYVTCKLLETHPQFANEKIDKCTICDGDLCNSSSKAGIAIFTLISCFLSYFIFK